MQARQAILIARKKIETVTPLLFDCGSLCASRCCQALDEESVSGMLLYPGEEYFYHTETDWYRILPSHLPGVSLFVCNGTCPREERPLACRLFPLLPIYTRDGKADVRIDMRGRGICPLCERSKESLSPAFVKKAMECAEILCQSEDILSFIKTIQNEEKQIRNLYRSLI